MSSTMNLMASRCLKTFLMRLVVIFMNVIFWIFVVKFVNIRRNFTTQWASIFQMSNAWSYKNLAWVKEPFKEPAGPATQKLSDVRSCSTLQLTFKLLSCNVVSKKNSSNYLKQLLKYSFHLKLQISANSYFKKIFNLKT